MNRVFPALALAILVVGFSASAIDAGIQNGNADRELGQVDLNHNTLDFGGPAALYDPVGTAVDRSVVPNRLYVVDTGNNRVLGYADETKLQNGSPADLVIGQPDLFAAVVNLSYRDSSTLWQPVAAAVDGDGNLYVVDQGNHRVLEYDQPFEKCGGVFPCVNQGAQRVFGQAGSFATNNCNVAPGPGNTNIPPTADTMCLPGGAAVDSAGNLYVADLHNDRVLEYNAPTKNSPLGSDISANKVFGQNGSFTSFGCDPTSPDSLCLDLPPPPRGIPYPLSITVDSSDNLWVPDLQTGRAVEFDDPVEPGGGTPGSPGSAGDTTADFSLGVGLDGQQPPTDPCVNPGANTLCSPNAVAVDPSGNVYVRDGDVAYQSFTDSLNFGRVLGFENPLIPSNSSCPGCGDAIADAVLGQQSFTNAACSGVVDASTISCDYPDDPVPVGLSTDSGGALLAADSGNNRVLIFESPTSKPTADLTLGQTGFSSRLLNQLSAHSLATPVGIAVDNSSAGEHVYVADAGNNRVLGWLDEAGFENGAPADLVIGQPDFTSVAAGDLSSPEGVAVDQSGSLYVANTFRSRVFEYRAPFSACSSFPCVMSEGPQLVFGTGVPPPNSACPGGASADTLSFPFAVAVDPKGNVYISDDGNNRVLEYYNPLAPGGGTPGKPRHAGDTTADLVIGQGDGGNNFGSCACTNPPNADGLCGAAGLALDAKGNLYVADGGVFEYLQPGLPAPGGEKVPGHPGDVTADVVFGQKSFSDSSCADGADCLFGAADVVVDPSGNVFVADTLNNRVLEYLDPNAKVRGTPGKPGSAGDTTADRVLGQNGSFDSTTCNHQAPSFVPNGPATASTLCFPSGLALDNLSNLFVSDAGNHRVLAFDFVPVAGKLALAPKAINFGAVAQNSSKSRKLTIRNVGRGKNAVAVGFQMETASWPFGIQKQCFGTLRVGEPCNVIVSFTPTDQLPHTGTLIIYDNIIGEPQQVQLSGTGRAPHR